MTKLCIITTFAILQIFQVVILADFSAFQFCHLHCGADENSACKCTSQGRRKEDLHNLTLFRKHVLHKFNNCRNVLASGIDSSSNSTKASNMNVLSYDLELEYVARCYALKYVFHHDKCRQTSRFARPGQIIARFKKAATVKEIGKFITEVFHTQSQKISIGTIDNYGGPRSGVESQRIDDFVQMGWWSHTHVGCARVYNPEAILEYDTYVVICNFGGPRESNLVGEPLYKKGKPCSKCVNNVGCNLDYIKLCGVQENFPEQALSVISKEVLRSKSNIMFCVISSMVLCYFFLY